MESAGDEAPAKRKRIEGHEKTQIPQETMLEVLLWLDRFHLDRKQISTRHLRSLVENKQMPLRQVDRVDYNGQMSRYPDPPAKSTLSIGLEKDEPANVVLDIETDADAQKAASYLSSCFVRAFCLFGHEYALPKNAIVAAPALICALDFRFCDFHADQEDTLSQTLDGSAFQSLALLYSPIPAWQIDDNRMESLRLRACNEINVCPTIRGLDDDAESFKVTEQGILDYCFTLDDNLPVPESRILRIASVNITPAFFKKVVEASKASRLTCDVELCLGRLQFDVGNLDVGVLPSRSSGYDRTAELHVRNVRYDIADHGKGVRLLIHFKSEHGEEWEVTVRYGKKDHEKFFEPTPEEEEYSQKFLKHEPEFEDPGSFDDDDLN